MTHQPSASYLNHAATYLLYALLLFTPLARGSVHLWAQTLIILVALVLVMIVVLEKYLTGAPIFQKTPIDKPLIALLITVIFSFAFAAFRPDGTEAITLLVSYIVLFYVTVHTVRTRSQQRNLVYVILAVAVLLSVIGLLKRFSTLDLSWWMYSHQPDDFVQLSGPYGNHSHLAGYLEMAIPLCLGLFLTRTRRGGALYLLLYVSAILICSHLLTLSRGGWVSLGLALACMASILQAQRRFKQKKLLSLLMTGTIAVILFVLSSTQMVERILTLTENETVIGVGGRMFAWQGVWGMIWDNPLFGTGPGSFATIFTQYQPPGAASRFFQAHNDYLHFISETGLILVPIVCWMLLAIFSVGYVKINNPSRQVWGITLGALMGILAILFHSTSDFNLHIPANAVLFTVLAALVCTSVEQRNGGRKATDLRVKNENRAEYDFNTHAQ